MKSIGEALVGAIVGVVLAATPATAQPAVDGPDYEHATSDFYRRIVQPGYPRARALFLQGLDHYVEIHNPLKGPIEKRTHLERALHRFSLAHSLAPDDPEILFFLARAESQWERPDPSSGTVHRMDQEAFAHFTQLRGLDPNYETEEVAFLLALLYTRDQRFTEAVAEYEHAITHSLLPDSSSVGRSLGNLAEVTMLSGDVAQAVGYYERGLEIARRSGQANMIPIAQDRYVWSGVLQLWGLAIALDRLGEHRHAVERAQEATQAAQDDWAVEVLRSDGVFFEPEYEIHWYEGLAYEARAGLEGDTMRERHLRRARRSFSDYLADGGVESRWADIARDNVERLDQLIEPAR